VLLIAAGLAPGTWWRSQLLMIDERPILHMAALPVPRTDLGQGLDIAGAWSLSSSNDHFSGYSTLLAMDDGTLLAVSDRSHRMRFAPPDAPHGSVEFDYFSVLERTNIRGWDIEGLTRDPASGRLWASYEGANYIERYGADFQPTGRVHPAEMRRWPANAGPEAIVRLADGRFIVLSEGSPRWFDDDLPGLLYRGDPVDGAKPVSFRYLAPEGFSPVDIAEIPDGRVLILLRRMIWGLPPHFETKLVVADPARIRAGRQWSGREIAHLSAPLPIDNFEGLAIVPGGDGELVLWLISDDNLSSFQRTLLLKLLWRPDEKARGEPRAPR
jgi:hypothetical protein